MTQLKTDVSTLCDDPLRIKERKQLARFKQRQNKQDKQKEEHKLTLKDNKNLRIQIEMKGDGKTETCCGEKSSEDVKKNVQQITTDYYGYRQKGRITRTNRNHGQ